MDFPVLCESSKEVAALIPLRAVLVSSSCFSRPETASVAALPEVEDTIPSSASILTRLLTCSLDVSEITPHSRAASIRELTASSPSCTPSVSKAYLKSVSLRLRSFRAFALSATFFPNLLESLPFTAFVNLLFAIAVSFNCSRTSCI